MPLRQAQLSEPINRTYTFMPVASTYASGKAALDKACRKESSTVHPLYILPDGSRRYRPLTMRENFQAQVEDFWTLKNQNGKKRTLDDRLRLFTDSWTDSCTSIAYKGGTSEFTIIPHDEALITLPANFTEQFLAIAYPAFPSMRLNSSNGKYNWYLTKQDVLDHEGWLTAIEGDQYTLRERVNITFSMLKEKYGREVGMSFHVGSSLQQDMRRALFVRSLSNNSDASGSGNLNYGGSFLRVRSAKNVQKSKR